MCASVKKDIQSRELSGGLTTTPTRMVSALVCYGIIPVNYLPLSEVEVHAELCYAEALLMTALITFLEDQNFLNLVRGAFRIRTCFQSYK